MPNPSRPKAPTVLAAIRSLGPIDATLLAWRGWYVTLLTSAALGAHRPVGIEVLPASPSTQQLSTVRSDWTRRWREQLKGIDCDEGRDLGLALHDLSLEPLLNAIDASDKRPKRLPAPRPPRGSLSGGAAALFDAIDYHLATAEGASPAKTIASADGVSLRAAESRIRRARKLGLLTVPTNNRARSLLTEKAVDLIEKATGERLYPYVTKNGETVLGPN